MRPQACHMAEYQLLPDAEKLLLDIISFYCYCNVRSYFWFLCVYFNTWTWREKRKWHKYQHFSPCEVSLLCLHRLTFSSYNFPESFKKRRLLSSCLSISGHVVSAVESNNLLVIFKSNLSFLWSTQGSWGNSSGSWLDDQSLGDRGQVWFTCASEALCKKLSIWAFRMYQIRVPREQVQRPTKISRENVATFSILVSSAPNWITILWGGQWVFWSS